MSVVHSGEVGVARSPRRVTYRRVDAIGYNA
jgi:hypothetical protein